MAEEEKREPEETLDAGTLENLQARRALIRGALCTISEVSPDDPRRAAALAHYNGQLAEIDARIAALTGTIPATVIGLQPGYLSARVLNPT